MVQNKFIESLVKSFSFKEIEYNFLSEKRIKEIKNIDEDFNMNYDSHGNFIHAKQGIISPITSTQKEHRKHFELILDNIFRANPQLGNIREKFSVHYVIHNDKTRTYESLEHNIILIDVATKCFIGRMNRVYTRSMELGVKEQIFLVRDILLFYTMQLKTKEFKLKVPYIPKVPNTPIHPNVEWAEIVSTLDDVHFSFLLAHELAHYLINNNENYQKRLETLVVPGDGLAPEFLALLPDLNDKKILVEVLVDQIAFELILNMETGYKHKGRKVTIIGCMVFLLIQYNIHSSCIYRTSPQDYEYRVWFARAASMRGIIRKSLKWRDDPKIVKGLYDEFLFPVLNPAASLARNQFNLLMKRI